MAKGKIGLIFRSPGLGGKSIEAIFNGLARYWSARNPKEIFIDDESVSKLKNGRALRRKAYSLYHFTGGAHHLLYFLVGNNILLTVHDVGRFKELSGLRKKGYYYLLLYFPFRIANKISTVSEYTKSDLLRFFPFLSPDAVRVIPNPVPVTFTEVPKSFNASYPRILQVGTQIHKNNARVIEALSDIPCKLVLIGLLSDSLRALIAKYQIDVEHHPELPYEEVHAQYAKCDMVVFASLHEGFGMPILEAQAIGRPVVASHIPAHKEIARDSVLFVDPESVPDIRARIVSVISDEALRINIVSLGFENIKRFSMPAIAAQYDELYEEMIQHHANV